MTDIKLPLVATSDHPEFPVLAWSPLELAEINRLMREAVRLNATVPDGDAAKDVNDTNAVLASRYFELLKVVEAYEKHGVTCQTFRHFVDTPCAECNCAPAAPQPRDDGMPASSDERHLRRLLAARVAMPNTYFDDGEANGAEHGIQIDFMRESVADIDAKLRALNVARLAVAAPQPAQPLTDEHEAILKECRNQAMRWTLEARIPEAGAFGGIAQDLDYLCAQLGAKND